MGKRIELAFGYVETSDNVTFAPDTSCLPQVPICGLCEEKLSEYIGDQEYTPYKFNT